MSQAQSRVSKSHKSLKEAWALIRDRIPFLGCFLGGGEGRSRSAAHLINADSTGHTAATDSELPVTLKKREIKKEIG